MIDLDFYKKGSHLIGCDEVGRGPLAGPVVGAAVILTCSNQNPEKFLSELSEYGITDSKKLSPKKRKMILGRLSISSNDLIPNCVHNIMKVDNLILSFVIIEKSHEYIDQKNILFASLKCMEIASTILSESSHSIILVDGNKTFENHEHLEQHTVVKGDSKSILIGLASIIAKEYRDNLMLDLDKKYAGYGLGKHAGYPTKQHREAIERLGPCPIHRKSFKGVKEFIKL